MGKIPYELPFKLNLQMFAEGDPTPPPAPDPTPPPKPEGKVWTDEYVTGLRAEAKEHRLAKTALDKHLRTVLGLSPEAEINEAAITTFQTTQQKAVSDAMSKANSRLLAAEIKALQGYDTKLVDKLIDRSKVTIEEDGTVTGLTEQIAALEVEFPAIKSGASGGSGVNPSAGSGGKTELQLLEDAYEKTSNMAEKIMLKNKIFALKSKT